MRAAWYDTAGPSSVLQVGELPDPHPGAGEVRVRIHLSGINPGDTKKRGNWQGGSLPYPRVIPHSDGAGVIDEVGSGVDAALLGGRVWVYGAQSYRAFGTAAQYCVVPTALAVPLPDTVDDLVGACLGIPGITAHRCVFVDGPVAGQVVLVHGALGAVGSLAAALARDAGAHVIATVRREADLAALPEALRPSAVALSAPDPVAAIRKLAPDGVDRIIEVDFAANVELDAAVARLGAVIAGYASSRPHPPFPFWPMLFDNLTIRLLGSDDFPAQAKARAARELTTAAARRLLPIAIGEPLPLEAIAQAHDRVDAGSRERVLLQLAPRYRWASASPDC